MPPLLALLPLVPLSVLPLLPRLLLSPRLLIAAGLPLLLRLLAALWLLLHSCALLQLAHQGRVRPAHCLRCHTCCLGGACQVSKLIPLSQPGDERCCLLHGAAALHVRQQASVQLLLEVHAVVPVRGTQAKQPANTKQQAECLVWVGCMKLSLSEGRHDRVLSDERRCLAPLDAHELLTAPWPAAAGRGREPPPAVWASH